MKISRTFLFLVLLLLAGILTGCAGGAGVATGWPGLTVDGETAYLAHGQHVYAINVTNGTEKWRFPAEADAKISFYAAPVLTEDGQLLAGGYNNVLYSLNPETGQENQGNWPFREAKNHFVASPVAASGLGIFAPSADRNLYALDFDGTRRWTFQTEHAQWATPSLDGQILYLPAMEHRIYALDALGGNVIWKTDDLGGAVVGTPTLGPDGRLYIGTFASQMLALDTATGKITGQPFTTVAWVWSGPLLEDDRLYFGDLDGNLYALNASDLSQIWSVHPDPLPGQAIPDRPLVNGDAVYFGSESGTLYAVDAETGSPRWNKLLGGKIYGSPVAAGDVVLVSPIGSEALLYALEANGNQKWAFTPVNE